MADTDWASRYDNGDTPWDKGAPAPALAEGVARGFISGRILVPGCGYGHDARFLAEILGASVVGLDLVPAAVESARRIHGKSGLPLEFVAGDFFGLPKEYDGAFDTVAEHTCFCAIHPTMRSAYAASAARVLKPGGRLFAIFFLDPGVEQGPPHGCTTTELDALFGGCFEPEAEWAPETCFPGREGGERVRVLRRR